MKFLATPTAGATMFMLAVFLLRSSGRGSVRLGSTPEAGPTVVAPPLPEDAPQRLRHAFDQLAAWERSAAFRALKLRSPSSRTIWGAGCGRHRARTQHDELRPYGRHLSDGSGTRCRLPGAWHPEPARRRCIGDADNPVRQYLPRLCDGGRTDREQDEGERAPREGRTGVGRTFVSRTLAGAARGRLCLAWRRLELDGDDQSIRVGHQNSRKQLIGSVERSNLARFVDQAKREVRSKVVAPRRPHRPRR